MISEPVPYYRPGAIPPASYTSLSYSLQTSSSSDPPTLSHRTTASSSKNGSRLQYSNGLRPTLDGERTPISSNEYLPQVSNTSYFDGISPGNYLSNINETRDDVYQPPNALPPTLNPTYSSQSPLFNSYSEEIQDTNGYEKPPDNQLHQVASYNSFQQFIPPPPPPPVASEHTVSSSEHYVDSSSDYAEADRQVPSRAPQYEYPEAGPSNIEIEDEELNWDQNSYAYADGYDGPDALVPGHEIHHATEMLRSIADYSPRGPLELHDEPQDEYWEDDEEEDESRFVNFSLLSHIAVQLRDKVPRGTHVKGSIPYPRAFTGKDIVVCPFQTFFSVLIHFFSLQVNYTITNSAGTCHQPWSVDK